MRELFDWLADHIEPYVSFRWLLAMVFVGIFVNWVVGLALWLREASRPGPTSSPRERQMLRIGRTYLCVLLLRSVSWRNLREQFGLILQIGSLLLLAVALSVAVFARP